MAIQSGRYAYVNNVSCVQLWTAQLAVAQQRYAASCVGGGTNVPSGVKDWTGTVSGVGAQPPLFPDGEDFTFQGVIDNTGGDLLSLNGTILFEQLTIDINKETGAPIQWVATWGAQGDLTEAATGAADSAVSGGEFGVDLAIELDTTAVDDVRTCQLVFRRPSTSYVSGGLTYRKPGNLEADLNFAVYNRSQEVALYAPNVLRTVEVFVDPTNRWQLETVRMGGKTGFTVDRQSTNIIGYTVTGMWNGAQDSDLGYIQGPDGTDYFGTGPT